MGYKTSSFYMSQIVIIEDKIAEEIDLAGVKKIDNQDDQLELSNRLTSLRSLLEYYTIEYNSALLREGTTTTNPSFIPRMEYGN